LATEALEKEQRKLKQSLQASEHARKAAKFNVDPEMLRQADRVKELFDGLMEGKALRHIHDRLETHKIVETVGLTTKQTEADLSALKASSEDEFGALRSLVQSRNDKLDSLLSLLESEYQKRDEQRKRENQTLDKINTYLDEWT
jgi:hypothetical protein